MNTNDSWKRPAFIGIYLTGFVLSAINPKDRFTWFLEIFPAIIALALISFTYNRFRLTDITYFSILVLCTILFIGGHYTYAKVPLFDWIRDTVGQERNNFDKVGHFAQGFVPAVFFREIFIRLAVVNSGRWLPFLVLCICMAISACYELLEWFVALTTGEAAEAFLGTQGYVWDTQSDMLMALIGSVTAMLFITGLHDRQIVSIANADTSKKQQDSLL